MYPIIDLLPADFEAVAEETFFQLMMNGWGSGAPRRRRAIYGNKMYSYYFTYGNVRGWHAVDEWRENTLLGNHSSGETTIWYKQCLVWQMQYSGWYTTEVIPHLKTALHENYSQRIWHGGRGPEQWSSADGDLCYMNNPHMTSFAHFFGMEFIGKNVPETDRPKVMGIHHYRGGFMFHTPDDT